MTYEQLEAMENAAQKRIDEFSDKANRFRVNKDYVTFGYLSGAICIACTLRDMVAAAKEVTPK